MFFMNIWPRQTLPSLMFGTTCSAVGVSVVAWACHADHTNLIYGMMALTGFGVGLTINPGTLHALAYVPGMTAAVSCLAAFCTPFGGTIALTIMTTVFNNRSGPNHEDPRTGIVWAFISMIPIIWVAVFITLFLGNVWLGKDGNHELVHGYWILNMLRGRSLEKVKVTRKEDAGVVGGKGEINLDTVRQYGVLQQTDVEQGR